MPLTLDASTPASTTIGQAVTSAVSPTFSPPANSVLFALVMATYNGSVANSHATISNSGTALTWTLLGRDTGMVPGGTDVWWASNSSAQSNITVTATLATATFNIAGGMGILRVLVFTGAATSQTGAVTTRNSNSAGTPSLAVTTTAANSWVWAAFTNPTTPGAPTAGANQTVDVQLTNAGAGYGEWSQKQNATTSTSGTAVTMNDTAPTGIGYDGVAFEILAAPSGAMTASLTSTSTLGPAQLGVIYLAGTVSSTSTLTATLNPPLVSALTSISTLTATPIYLQTILITGSLTSTSTLALVLSTASAPLASNTATDTLVTTATVTP